MITITTQRKDGSTMSKPRRRGLVTPYAIYYRDGSYMIYDLVEADYKALKDSMAQRKCVELSIGFFATDDIRAIIEQREVEQKEEQNVSAVPDLDIAELEFLKQTLAGVYDKEMEVSYR